MSSAMEIFRKSGPSHLTAVDWKNPHHRRAVAASLVQGAYKIERDRQENLQGLEAHAPPWWEFFHFQLKHLLIDDVDRSIFGVIYEYKLPASYFMQSELKTPRYVIAFRGTLTLPDTWIRDLKLNFQCIIDILHQSSRFKHAMQSIQNMVSLAGEGNVWLAGHSLGSALALLAGKSMTKMGFPLETYLFNPPFISAATERITYERVKHVIRIASSVVKAGLSHVLKSRHRRFDSQQHQDPFVLLSAWSPYLFLNQTDDICNGYITYFEQRKKMDEIGARRIGRVAIKNSIERMLSGALGKVCMQGIVNSPSVILIMLMSIGRENVITLVWVLAQLMSTSIEASSSVAGTEAKTTIKDHHLCLASSCGSISNISYPFRLKGHDPPNCGDPRFELSCENNRTIFYLYSLKFYVLKISYDPYFPSVQIVDANLDTNVPLYPIQSPCNYYADYYSLSFISLLNCTQPVLNSSKYMDASPCIHINNYSYPNTTSSSSSAYYLYVLASYSSLSDIHESCYVKASLPANTYNTTNKNIVEICRYLLMGFTTYPSIKSEPCHPLPFTRRIEIFFRKLWWYHNRQLIDFFISLGAIIFGRASLGFLCLLAICIYKLSQRHLSVDNTIEEFLQSQNNLMPIRYSYPQIKRMTKGFKSKLGQGGYGSVFKGKLQSGHPVAIKVLNKVKANGQDFINEVATIGRIHHVNVVRLIGFCVDGSKRALVYEYMPNGSLDTFIFSHKGKTISLNWETTYDIALGVARGIEYLHRGCDMQILHFDIKPHNILLDQNFVPKVSDFGLAKLYPVDDSNVSLTAARGTLGYIAPELFYNNIGGISYKADVYSFGMLLMEMVWRRKNLNAFTERTSKIYFSSWIYDKINQGQNLELGNATDGETQIVRKLLIVAFWCIQMKPIDRPSMGKVLEMLQQKVEFLQMPSKPFLCPPEPDVK
ncbi:hypothetical protein FNV43_RR23926 [Rhamnella rubrinervis]|uniref:Protein kinase domain-containing protein n=1 Tax=Rhamnella rubrinervis TaxID=2594499 RepID=A0A8K0DRA1_9ROSA|nr:hypothetical protein FNV43_RR23926 [Rhamnella rubrinervis]